MQIKNRSVIPGLFLILLGIYLLGRQLDWFEIRWIHIYPFILLILGIRSLNSYRSRPDRQSLFWAVFLILTGLFFLLRNFEIIPFWYIETAWPVFTLAVGFGFLALFFLPSHQKTDLVISSLFIAFSGLAIAHNLGWFLNKNILQLWPLLLIALGIGIIRNSMRNQTQH